MFKPKAGCFEVQKSNAQTSVDIFIWNAQPNCASCSVFQFKNVLIHPKHALKLNVHTNSDVLKYSIC